MTCSAPTSVCTGRNPRRIRMFGRSELATLCEPCREVYEAAPFAFHFDVLPAGNDRRSPHRPRDWRSRFGFRRRSDRARESWARRLWVRA